MDVIQHGEEAYVTGEGAILLTATPEEAELMTRGRALSEVLRPRSN